ncbi:MAG TPA: hypothetical protein IAA29_04930 [Candidatus Paenibacillus intestinavium]|nr:hypothetical protein [Candidatus Paenibacillus intestinavium]
MSAPKRKPATMKVKPKEEVNKKALYWTVGVAVVVVIIISVLLIVFS